MNYYKNEVEKIGEVVSVQLIGRDGKTKVLNVNNDSKEFILKAITEASGNIK